MALLFFIFLLGEVVIDLVLKDLVSLDGFFSLKSLSRQGLVFLLKHSSTSPLSAGALRVFSDFSGRHGSVPCFVLGVREARNVSSRVEEDTGVGHEVPQVLLFRDGVVVWSVSGAGVSLVALENALRKHSD